MKNQTLTFVLVIALAAAGGWWMVKSVSPETTQGATSDAPNLGPLTLSESSYNFGTIKMSEGEVSKSFSLTNSTGGDIFLSKVTTSCMCTVAYLTDGARKKGPFGMPGHGGPVSPANELIRSGETRELEVVFDPNAHGPAGIGKITRAIYLEDSSGSTTEIRIEGLVTP